MNRSTSALPFLDYKYVTLLQEKMSTSVLVMGSPKILGPFLKWKRSSNVQLKAVTGHLCGLLTSSTISKRIGEHI